MLTRISASIISKSQTRATLSDILASHLELGLNLIGSRRATRSWRLPGECSLTAFDELLIFKRTTDSPPSPRAHQFPSGLNATTAPRVVCSDAFRSGFERSRKTAVCCWLA